MTKKVVRKVNTKSPVYTAGYRAGVKRERARAVIVVEALQQQVRTWRAEAASLRLDLSTVLAPEATVVPVNNEPVSETGL